MDIPIRVMDTDITAKEAVQQLHGKYDVRVAKDFSEVEGDSLLVLSCPNELIREFRFHKGTIYRNAIEVVSSGIVPEACATKMVVLINKGRLWKRISTLIEETVRMYIRYQIDQAPQDRLPWGGICPHDPRATDWIAWWETIDHQWSTDPVEVYKSHRRRDPRVVRVSVSDYVPSGVSLI